MAKNKSSAANQPVVAIARARDVEMSPKHAVEISNCIRYKTTIVARKILDDVIAMRHPIAFTRHNKDTGHKPGMAAGRFPRKAAAEFLRLLTNVEANAHGKGLNTAHLKIIKLYSNRASAPWSGGRLRHSTKRCHVDIEVKESNAPHHVSDKEKLKSTRRLAPSAKPASAAPDAKEHETRQKQDTKEKETKEKMS